MSELVAWATHQYAMGRMLDRHPRLRNHPTVVQASYEYLYPFVEQLPIGDALEVIARHAESLLDD